MATAKKPAAAQKPMAKPEIARKTGKTGASKSILVKPRASAATQKPLAPVKRKRADWQAIARDYRTGAFTDQELADKNKNVVTRQAISKMAKAKGWQKDLTAAVRQATKAGLIVDQAEKKVAEQVAQGCVATLDTVLAAAETNKQVILGHRDDIRRTRALANFLLEELAGISIAPSKVNKLVEVLAAGEEFTASETLEARQAVSELVKLPSRIQSVQRLSQVMARLQPLERKAFGLDDDIAPSAVDAFDELSDEELDRRIDEGYERHRPR